jgi:hypothetical protein
MELFADVRRPLGETVEEHGVRPWRPFPFARPGQVYLRNSPTPVEQLEQNVVFVEAASPDGRHRDTE